LILEGIIFHPKLEKHASIAKDALLPFQREKFVFVKTACRRILEHIRRLITDWNFIGKNESLCEKLSRFYSSPETTFDSSCITSVIFLISSRSLSLRFLITLYAFFNSDVVIVTISFIIFNVSPCTCSV